jgi:A/G-specific adenine glycosylase
VEERPSLPDGYIWIREADIQDYGVPRLIEIMLNEINA